MTEVIAANGKIFKQKSDGSYEERGGKGIKLTGQEMRSYEKYTGVKTERVKDSIKKNPQFTELMWDNANRKAF